MPEPPTVTETLTMDAGVSDNDMTFRVTYHIMLTEQDLAILRAMSQDDIFLLAGAAYARGMRLKKDVSRG